MKEHITPFLEQKNISENSKLAYSYDLEQFVNEIHSKVTETNLRIYQGFQGSCPEAEALSGQSISLLSL